MSIKKGLAILSSCVIFFSIVASAQSGKLPPFRVMQSNGKIFKAEDLPMGKPIVIIYFSPECDHCQVLMKDFIKRAIGFNKASVAMVTHLALDKVSAFVKDYNLKLYPNVYVGTEGTSYFLKHYYKIHELPFIALYNKNGELQKLYDSHYHDALKDVVIRLKKLE